MKILIVNTFDIFGAAYAAVISYAVAVVIGPFLFTKTRYLGYMGHREVGADRVACTIMTLYPHTCLFI